MGKVAPPPKTQGPRTAPPAPAPAPTRRADPPTPPRRQRDQVEDNSSNDSLPPHSVEAEDSVLGSMLIDPNATVRVAGLLSKEDFYQHQHGMLYDALLAVYERHGSLDVALVDDYLQDHHLLEDLESRGTYGGRMGWLIDLITRTPTSVHAEHYANVVEEYAVRRRLITAGGRIANIAYDQKTAVTAITEAQAALLEATNRKGVQEALPMSVLMERFVRDVENRRGGDIFASSDEEGAPVSTGFFDFDALTGGLHPGDLNIVAGRPGTGKTALALMVGLHAAEQGVPTAMFSLEMSHDQLSQRMVATRTNLDVQSLRLGLVTEADWQTSLEVSDHLAQLPLHVDDTPALSHVDLHYRAKRLQFHHGIRLVIIDYLQLVHGTHAGRFGREAEVAEVSNGLRTMAREMRVPVLALAQMNRRVEYRKGRPQLSDLRESGAIEQDADMVVFLYREEDEEDAGGFASPSTTTEVIVAKHRNGPTGAFHLLFEPKSTRFENMAKSGQSQ
jgi:replicative DNA helicase